MAESAPSVFETTKASMVHAAAAYSSVTSGPIAQNVKDHTAKTSSEFSNLAASRKTPTGPTATGQPLTHYHSFFYELLSWKNPRASAISFVSAIFLILAVRYLDVARWVLRLTWMTLGVTVSAEVAGKLLFSSGLASQIRPRKYTTVSRETIDTLTGDFHELINFIVIETQRIVFVENIPASLTAAVAAFMGYHLTKVVPYWGLALMATILAFTVPLVYVTNKEIIDEQLKNASDLVGAQTAQVRSVAQKQTEQLTALGKQYAGDYTGKVQEMIRGRGSAAPSAPTPAQKAPEFPSAPTTEPAKTELNAPSAPTEEPVAPKKEEESLI